MGKDLTVTTITVPPVQGPQNEPGKDLTVTTITVPPVQGPQNEPDADYTIPLAELKDVPMLEDEQPSKMVVPLNGKLITAEDPITIGTNFRSVINMRYKDKSLASIGGMTKINASEMDGTYFKTRNAHHFRKIQPAAIYELMTLDVAPATPWGTGNTITGNTSNKTCVIVAVLSTTTYIVSDRSGAFTLGEVLTNGTTTADQGAANPTFTLSTAVESHVLTQSYNTTLDTVQILQQAGMPPLAGEFELTELMTDTADLGQGFFSDAPNGQVAYCNGDGSFIWGGNGIPVSRFLNFDSAGTFKYDHTDILSNAKVSDTATLVIDGSAGGAGSDTAALLHLDENVTDSGPVVFIAFATGSHEPSVGDTVRQVTSSATGVISVLTLASGAWAAGTAAGTISLDSVTGTWTNGNNMIESTAADLLAGTGSFTGAATGWTLGAGWAYGTDNVVKSGDGTATLAKDTLAAVAGEVYRVTYTISSLTVGTVTASFGGASGAARSADGTYTETLTATTTAGLAFTPSNTARFTIDSVTAITTIASCTTCTTGHTVTNTNVTYADTTPDVGVKWGHWGWWNGTNAYLTIPDHPNFNFADGTWAFDCWFDPYNTGVEIPFYYQETPVTKVVYDTGAHEPTVGGAVHQDSGATGVIISYDNSGGWAGAGTGTIWLGSVTGTWANAEAMHDAGATIANCATCTTDTDYFRLEVHSHAGGDEANITIRYHGTETVPVQATGLVILNGTYTPAWRHIQFGENGNDWYILYEGNLVATGSNAIRAGNHTSTVYIGRDPYANKYYHGYMEEIRISMASMNTSSFAVPTAPYVSVGGTGNVGKVYIQTPRPAQGFKFYVAHANTSGASTVAGAVWNGSDFSTLTLTDGTAVSGATLAKTGSITFASTVTTAEQKYLEGTLAYCYEFTFSSIDSDTSIYHVTVDCPFQAIVDIWDGIGKYIAKFYLYKSAYQDYSVNVYQERYDSTDPTSFVELDSLTSAQHMEIGFIERMTSIDLNVVPSHVNTTANTVATVYYWTGSTYTSVGTITDGTAEGAISLAKRGVISWAAPAESAEQKKAVGNGVPLYYYKIVWNNTLSADVQLSYVSGIPAPKTIRAYKFPLFGQERLLLCNNVDEDRNSILYAADGTAQTFNGSDSGKIYFGDNSDLMCGCNVFSQFAQNLYNITLIFKEREMWGLVRGTDGWQKYRISDTIGCNAPKTLKTAVIPPISEDKGGNRNIAIWMRSSDGVYISDGRHPILVSHDIRDMFDQNSAEHINQAYTQSASAWVDQDKLEYHLVFATTTGTVTTNDIEWVLDLRRWKWFKVDRGSGARLQCGVGVTDAYGNNFSYGFIDTGFMERLEYGNTFDGNAIPSQFHTGDFSLNEGDFLTETRVRKVIQAISAKGKTNYTSGALIVGKIYRITAYTSDDDFTNVGAASNATGVEFTATGTTPTHWAHSSSLIEVKYTKLTHFVDTQEEILTLDVAPATAWTVNDTITGETSATTCKITRVDSTKVFAIRERTGDFSLGEVLKNQLDYHADQGAANPTITGPTDYSCDLTKAGYRIAIPLKNANSTPGVVHSLKETVTVNNEVCGFEPMAVGVYYENVRDFLS